MDGTQLDLKRHYQQGMADRQEQIIRLLKRNVQESPNDAYKKAFTQLIADIANDGARFNEEN